MSIRNFDLNLNNLEEIILKLDTKKISVFTLSAVSFCSVIYSAFAENYFAGIFAGAVFSLNNAYFTYKHFKSD